MQFLVQVLLITGIWGCQEDTYELDFAGPELIINGVLVAGESPQIFVGKTWPATGQIPEKPYVEDAQVELLESGQPVGKLTYLSNGTYGLSSYKIEAGKTYTVRVQGLGMQAQSRPVRVPLPFPLQHAYMDYQAKVTSPNDHAKPHLLRVGIKDYQEPGNYYGVAVAPYVKGYLLSTIVSNVEVSNSGLNYREDDCFTRSGFLKGGFEVEPYMYNIPTMIIYNDACFAELAKEFGIVAELYGTAQAKPLFNADADELRLQLAVLSPEYVAFTKTWYKPEGIDNAFIEPKRTYTNIEGGHGVVAAMNLVRKSVQVRLPSL